MSDTAMTRDTAAGEVMLECRELTRVYREGPRDLTVLDALERTEPFPLQRDTLPDSLAGRDLLGRGRTGSGKTLAFGLPLLARLADGDRARAKRPHAVVLVPTRELAMQVSDALEPFVHVTGLRHRLVAGGRRTAPSPACHRPRVQLRAFPPYRTCSMCMFTS